MRIAARSVRAPRRRSPWIVAVALLAVAAAAPAATGTLLADSARLTPLDRDERELAEVLEAVRGSRMAEALARAEDLVRRNPEFRLAQLVYADLLSASDGRLPSLALDHGSPALAELRDEARLRFAHLLRPPARSRVPDLILRLSKSQPRAVVVDISNHRLYLFERADGRLRLVRDFYVTTGRNGAFKRREGDQRTPVGTYFVTGRLDDGSLPDLYGAGAFPIDYPNEWDRRNGRTGYGIWIHGVPMATYNRAPRASDGCMAIPNANLRALWDSLPAGTTPVLIADRLRWVDPDKVAGTRAELSASIERWRRDWERRDAGAYESHYAKDFHGERMSRARWFAHKRRVNAVKRYIRVGISDLSEFLYPGENGLAVVTFDQDYRSSNYARRSRKRQYWRREPDGRWRIVYEGTARFLPVHLRGIPYSARSQTASR